MRSTTGSTTVTVEAEEVTDSSTTPILRLRLKEKEQSVEKKKVAWTNETVRNLNLNFWFGSQTLVYFGKIF